MGQKIRDRLFKCVQNESSYLIFNVEASRLAMLVCVGGQTTDLQSQRRLPLRLPRPARSVRHTLKKYEPTGPKREAIC